MDPISFEDFSKGPQKATQTRYSPACEEPPDHLWFKLPKKEIHGILEEISRLVQNACIHIPESDRELRHIHDTARTLKHLNRSPAIKVALLGAQGAGKSLLINALFDYDHLSLTGADGAACTSSIVRYAHYRYADKTDHQRNFCGEISFLSRDKREEMIQEHVRSYAHYHADIGEFEGETNRSSDQDELDRRLKDTAEDVFITLFGSRDDFLEAWAANPSHRDFARLCALKCDEALEHKGVNGNGVKSYSRPNQRELLQKIKPFLTNVEGEACLWPLVDMVTIYFDHNLLEQGVEILDLPGSGDINVSRTRHADEIKDSVDLEMILADTIRIATDDQMINSVRSGVLNRGASNVKMVATKIDAISDNQMSHCSGKLYDNIKARIQAAEADAIQAEEDGEEVKSTMYSKYKTYLERHLKERKIQERAQIISTTLATKLEGRTAANIPEIFHISAGDYMKWVVKDKILFKDQPALRPETTGIPSIRKYLLSLPAEQNLADYTSHLNIKVPAFIEKIKRVVAHSDERDAGWKTISGSCDEKLEFFIRDLTSQGKSAIRELSKRGARQISNDGRPYKIKVDNVVRKQWLGLKHGAFSTVLKSRGYVPKGKSKAQGVDNGCNWNQELASIIKPAVTRLYEAYKEPLSNLFEALVPLFDQMLELISGTIHESAANLTIVERANRKWKQTRLPIKNHIIGAGEKLGEEQRRLYCRITMEDNRENNLVASVTDELFDQIFASFPELKKTNSGKKSYVTPITKWRKQLMDKLFLQADDHIVDKLSKTFLDQLEKSTDRHIDQMVKKISTEFHKYSDWLEDQSPIDYELQPRGYAIRDDLREIIPELERKAEMLRGLLPKFVQHEEDGSDAFLGCTNESESSGCDLKFFLDQAKKRKRAGGSATVSGVKAKRKKH